MKTSIRSILASSLFLFAAAPFAQAVDNGEKAPDFTLTSIEGKEHSLSDFSGKYVVLEWTNPGCPFVQKFYEAGEMQRLQKELTGEDVVWLTINSTNSEHRDYLDADATKKLGWNYASTAVLLDPDSKVGKMYDAKTTPHMYVITPDGTLVYQGAIDSIRSADPEDISKADNYVTAALEASRNDKEIEHANTRPYGCSVKYP